MTMRRTFVAKAGSVLVAAILALPAVAYGQVDERTQQGRGQTNGQATDQAPSAVVKPAATPQAGSLLVDLSHAIRSVAASTKDSVVHIEVTEGLRKQGGRDGRSPGAPSEQDEEEDGPEEGPQFRGRGQLPPDVQDRLREFFENIPRQQPQTPSPRRGLGSGIVYDDKGHILTNSHVVRGASKIKVLTTTGQELRAEVVGTDPLTDVAVIKVTRGDGLKPAAFGDSSKVEVGDLVLAMGNPFGLDFSVTFGIISATGRGKGLQLGNIYYKDFLQTDAAINPGNSGGPLVNMTGQVIGMSTAIATQTGQYAGVGFAIPSSLASRIADILIEKGSVTRGWLGVGIDDLSPGMAKTFGLPADSEGVLVMNVRPDSPAATAGFQAGDIIVKMNGQRVRSSTQLQTTVTFTAPGTEVKFEVWREGKTMTLTAELGELEERYLRETPGSEEEGQVEPGAAKRFRSEELGISYTTPTDEMAEKYGWSTKPKGAMVVRVDPAGEAANLAIQEGDVIQQVNNIDINTAPELRDALKKVIGEDGSSFRMRVRGPRFQGRYVLVQPQ